MRLRMVKLRPSSLRTFSEAVCLPPPILYGVRPPFSVARSSTGNFTGVAQVPIGLAGPLRIAGEHAQGDFYIPMATTEGTLVASYNRGMRLLGECGGVRATVVDDRMQRAPVFIFSDALAARAFGEWVSEHRTEIVAAAEATIPTAAVPATITTTVAAGPAAATRNSAPAVRGSERMCISPPNRNRSMPACR